MEFKLKIITNHWGHGSSITNSQTLSGLIKASQPGGNLDSFLPLNFP